MLVSHADRIGREIGENGVWGNLGVAFAALLAGALTQWLGCRWAFWIPGGIACARAVLYLAVVPRDPNRQRITQRKAISCPKGVVFRAFAVLALGGGRRDVQCNYVARPKLFAERIPALAHAPSAVGVVVCIVYVLGAVSHLIVGRVIDRYPLKIAFFPLAVFRLRSSYSQP
jgi:predicted MFS family arabinose efflux permease